MTWLQSTSNPLSAFRNNSILWLQHWTYSTCLSCFWSSNVRSLPLRIPEHEAFFIHSSHIFLSVLLCVLFAYIFGLICRIVGKRISDWLCMNAMRNSCKKNFSTTFSNMLKASSIESSTIRTMIDNGQEMMAYSYMWMKLDSCSDADCRNRFFMSPVYGYWEPFMRA